MHDLVVANIHIFLWVIAVGELGFVYAFTSEFWRNRKPIVACMLAVSIGLTIDAFVVALGGIIDQVPFLFSRLRFICHGTLLPFAIPICAYSLRAKKNTVRIVWLITLLLMLGGLIQALNVELVETYVGTNLRYAMGLGTPSWARIYSFGLSFGAIIPLIITGALVWKREKVPYLFTGGLLMFVFAAIGPVTGNMDLLFVFTMIGEVLMLVGYYFYLKCLLGEIKIKEN